MSALAALAGSTAFAIDFSQTVHVERYTILDSSTLLEENGSLLPNGKFKTLTSGTTGLFGFSIEDFEPFSGRPIISVFAFNTYKNAGIIPKWRRSRDEFFIGSTPYVIVSTASGPDPNPIPIILTQPESRRALLGGFVFFQVDTTLFGSVTYQWKHKNKPLPGKTSFFLFLSNIQKTDAGKYTVEISTGSKPVVSKPALLQIVIPVAIKTPPKSQTFKSGKRGVVRVAATGTGPFTYQWSYNGDPIAGAINSFYTIPSVTAETAGNYTVRVSNGLSEATSIAGTISVVP